MADLGVQGRTISAVNGRVTKTFAALQFYNYRLWFLGQLVSLVGTWMQMTAQGFFVFELTGSPAYLGIVGFAAGVPSWFLMLYAGVIADRFPRRTLLMIAQVAMMILAFVLAALVFTGLVEPWHIVLLAFLTGIANAFEAPARISFVRELVDREHMSNAIAMNSTMFQAATVAGPAIAGVTYATFGPAWCFVINGISYLAVLVALWFMRIEREETKPSTKSPLEALKEGLNYVVHHSLIRTMILIAAVASLFGFAFVTLMPAWAVNVLGGDSATNGYMQSARGIGALAAALMIASLGNFKQKGKLMTIGSFVFPILLIVFAFITSIPLSLLVLVGVGWGFMLLFNLLNVLTQHLVDDNLRGRVMSIYTLTFFGGMPIGSLWAGALAEQFGEPITVIVGALISLAFSAFVFWKMPQIRKLQ
jgi:MFS family permease